MDEVALIIKNLKDSAAGHGNIPAKILKFVNLQIANPISHLVNLSFRSSRFPQTLKEAIVTPIHKRKFKLDFANFRPVSVLVLP